MDKNSKAPGTLREMLSLMDAGVRSSVFKLNQAGFVTFSSCDGHEGKATPHIDILCRTEKDVFDVIHFIEDCPLDPWYTLSNRFYDNSVSGGEMSVSSEDNIKRITFDLQLDWDKCYFLVIKFEALDELKQFVDLIVRKRKDGSI